MHLLSNHIWILFDSIATLLGRTWAEPVGDDRWPFDLNISAPIVFPLMFDCPHSPSPLPVCPQNPTFNWSQIRCSFAIWYRFLPPLSHVRSLRRLGILISRGGWSRSTPNCTKSTRNWRCFFSHFSPLSRLGAPGSGCSFLWFELALLRKGSSLRRRGGTIQKMLIWGVINLVEFLMLLGTPRSYLHNVSFY